jgi:hypothetical protein
MGGREIKAEALGRTEEKSMLTWVLTRRQGAILEDIQLLHPIQ